MLSPPDAERRPASPARRPPNATITTAEITRPISTGRVIALEIDFATGEITELRAVTAIDRARIFAADLELQRFARVLAEAHGLVLSATVPRSVRRDLGAIVDLLDELLHGAPHCEARTA